jgi:RHS repeat-associated protein
MQTLTWDAEGHLATVSDSTGTTSYLYDANGNRLISRDPTGTTLYLPGQELRLTKATGTVSCTRYYTHGGTTVASRTPSGISWLAPDWQGTSQTAIDAVTQQVTQRRQTPFGARRGSAVNWPNPHGFVGGVSDNTGLVHLGAREYDPGTGRFVSPDPLLDTGDPQQMEGYAYSDNNPITYSDPTGLLWSPGWIPDGGMDLRDPVLPSSSGQGGPSPSGQGTPSSQPVPKQPAKKKCRSWDVICNGKKAIHATVNWVDDHKAVIAGVAAGVVAGAVCEAVTAGTGTVGCLALAGAVGSMVQYTVETKVEHKGSFSWGGLLLNGAVGAATGVLLGGSMGGLARGAVRAAANTVAKVAGKAVQAASGAVRSTVRNAVKTAMARAASNEVGKRTEAAAEGAATAFAGSVYASLRQGQGVNWADATIAAGGGAIAGFTYHTSEVASGALGGFITDGVTQVKNAATGNSDHVSFGELALSSGAGAAGGQVGRSWSNAVPRQASKPVGLYIGSYLGGYDVGAAMHDYLRW